MTLVDLHAHLLPGADDGSTDLRESLDLARVAAENGITHILLTPHHMDGKYVNHKKDVIRKTELFQMALDKVGIEIKVFPGQEVHLTDKLLDAIDNDDILFADANNRYLMLELPHTHVPSYFMQNILPELQNRGITPVIVHPERNQEIQRNHELLYELVEAGCLTQITAGSYVGSFGEHVSELTEKIIDANLGTTFSSDMHVMQGREPRMDDAYRKLSLEDKEKAELYRKNAESILNGEDVVMANIEPIKEKKGFWERIFRKRK